MADIFISYAREDRETAKTLGQALADQGWSVWWDQSIPPGKTWADVIGKQLNTARCVLALWSKTSVTTRWVLREARFAEKRGTLIPILMEGVEPPFEFGDIQAADLIDWQGDVSYPGYKLLLKAVSEMLGASPTTAMDEQDAKAAKRLADLPKLEIASDLQGIPDLATFRDLNASWCPEMVATPAGTFLMGSPEDEKGRYSDESPHHLVMIRYRFAIGRYPVTFEQYDHFCDANTWEKVRDEESWGRGRRPVINISWQDAQAYCEWLSRATSQAYRLPSEAEWEYACRAGTTTRYSFGNEITPKDANYGESKLGKTTEVGAYPPNAWGLYDMHGNVREWLEDVWNESYEGAPADSAAWTDDEGRQSSRERVVRGGSWFNYPWFCRSADRNRFPAEDRDSRCGFRVARTLD